LKGPDNVKTSRQFREEVVELNVPADQLAFWWLGQHGWIVKTTNYLLGFDLYLKDDPRRLIKPVLQAEDCDFFDFLFATHEHTDHFDQPALEVIAKASTKTRFVLPKILQTKAAKIGIAGRRVVLLDAQKQVEYSRENLRIISIPSAHEFLEIDPETGSQFLGYIVYVDGFCLYHSGDTCYYDGMLGKLREHTIDIAFVPINGRDGTRYRRNTIGNLTYQEAVDLVGQAKVCLACPAHHGMFAHNTQDPVLFIDYLTAKYPNARYWVGPPHELVWYERPLPIAAPD
jgi:L-ascorbate metabolism protein UlaG (beta-lactamase superfamily)